MNAFVWITMGIAIWHFAVFVPDHFWGGIVGAFGAAAAGAFISGFILAGGQFENTSVATALEAVRLGAAHYLTKPATADEILASFARAAGGSEPLTAELEPDDVPSLDRVEWEHINRVLMDCQGNISEAARTLRIHRRSLQRKLARYPPAR